MALPFTQRFSFTSPPHLPMPPSRAGSSPLPLNRPFPSTHPLIPPRVHTLPTVRCSCSAQAFPDRKAGNGMTGFHEIELKVRDYELPQYGVLDNAVYANYCQHGMHELVNRIGINCDKVGRAGDALAFSELSLKMLAPLKSGDKFAVKVRISGYSRARIYLEHFIHKLPNQEPILEGKAIAVWLDKGYRPVRIPQEFWSKFVQFLRLQESNALTTSLNKKLG